MIKNICSIILFCLIGITGNSQTIGADIGCGTSEAMQSWYRQNPASREEALKFNEFTRNFSKSASARTKATTYVIPVVFHIFGTDFAGTTVTDQKIITALEKVNEDFKGLNDDFSAVDADFLSLRGTLDIEFKLAKIDPQGNPTTGIKYYPALGGFGNGAGYNTQIGGYAWDNYKYMNVYIQLDLYNDGTTNNSGVAWYPDTDMSDNKLARVVYNGRYLYGNTDKEFASVLTHEFGHYLNLIHTFEDGCTYPNDEVADTPPTISKAGCRVKNCEGRKINGENYLDYNTSCYKMFTQGQVARMEAAIQHPARLTLWQLTNLIATGVTETTDSHIAVLKNEMMESKINDGSVNTTFNIVLVGASWSNFTGAMEENMHYTVANLPAGLTVKITRLSATDAKIQLEGNAMAHSASNSTSNLEITFLDSAVTNNNASELFNRTLTFKLTFLDPYEIIYSSTFLNGNDLIVNSSNVWENFSFTIGDAEFAGWFDYNKLRFESYSKAVICLQGTRNVTPLTKGTNIGSQSNWVSGTLYPGLHDISTTNYTNWHGKTAYIGVRFSINGNTNYGWVKASVSTNGNVLTLYDYAYNEAPDAPIQAGQTSEADTLASPVTGIMEEGSTGGVLYPNPNTGKFTITRTNTNSVRGSVQVKVMNAIGCSIQENIYMAKSDGRTFEIDITGVPAGFYYILVKTGSEEVVKKVIKE